MESATTTATRLSAVPRRGRFHAAIALVRPQQWVKNALVIAAAGAAGALGRPNVPENVALACLAFCLLSAGTYAVNDVNDAAEDRRHPRKRHRPVAAGEIAPRSALRLGIGLMVLGLAVCLAVRPLLFVVGAGYLALTLSYALGWRRIVILDIVAIAGGFVLRAVAGGVAAPVTLSRWFIVVVSCAALLIAAGKRYAELARVGSDVRGKRSVLRFYTPMRLRLILIGSGAGALFAYCVWAFQLPAIDGFPWRPLTIVPFAAALVRYGRLVLAGNGEAPEELMLHDRLLAVIAIVWLIVFGLGVNAAA
jgi:decaprenyl-phosphate phosphoribosyltransferase